MDRLRFTAVSFLLTLLLMAALPLSVYASDGKAQGGSVSASGVIVPLETAQLGFLITAPVSEMPIKEGDVVQAGQMLMDLNTPDLEYAVAAADAAYRSAEANAALQRYKKVRNFINGKVVWQDAPPEVRQIADAQALSALAALDEAKAALAQATLTAPFDATVISVKAAPGEVVQAGQPVITLAALDQMIIETTDLNERYIGSVRIGAPVTILVEALGKSFSGSVIRIAPKANIVGGDVVFKVTIAFDEQPIGLLWGMSAEVTIKE